MASKVRFLNAYCDAPCKFDIKYKGYNLCDNLCYQHYSPYCDVDPGQAYFNICPQYKHYSLCDAYTYANRNSYQTAVLTGLRGDLNFFVVPDAYVPVTTNSYIRFVNLAPNTSLDFTLVDCSTVLFRNVCYRQPTKYYPLYPDNYNIHVKLSGTNRRVLTIYDVDMKRRRFYTIYVFGHRRDSSQRPYLCCADGE